MLTAGADPVRKVSIIPRGASLGVTFSAPADDRFNYSQSELLARIKVALGGRAAEELVFEDVSTGAESDLQQLTQIARRMVGRWGMSDAIGKLVVLPPDGQPPWAAAGISPHTMQVIDDEARRLVEGADGEVAALLRAERTRLDAVAQALLDHETLDEDDAYAAAGMVPPEPTPPAPVTLASS
jgi:cell division protease FtsH